MPHPSGRSDQLDVAAAVDFESFLGFPPEPPAPPAPEPPESFVGEGSFLDDESPEDPESEPEEPESDFGDESVLVVLSLPDGSLEALFPFPLRESVL